MTLGSRIRSARKGKRLTQAQLAKSVGIEQGSISDIENEKVKPRQSTLRLLARELGDDFGIPEIRKYLSARGTSPAKELVEQVVSMVDGEGAVLEVFVARLAARIPAFESMLNRNLIPEIYRRAASYLTLVDAFDPNTSTDEIDFSEELGKVFIDHENDAEPNDIQGFDLSAWVEFDLDESIQRYDDAVPVLEDWYRSEGRRLEPGFLGMFSVAGWKKMSPEERKASIVDQKRILDMRLREEDE